MRCVNFADVHSPSMQNIAAGTLTLYTRTKLLPACRRSQRGGIVVTVPIVAIAGKSCHKTSPIRSRRDYRLCCRSRLLRILRGLLQRDTFSVRRYARRCDAVIERRTRGNASPYISGHPYVLTTVDHDRLIEARYNYTHDSPITPRFYVHTCGKNTLGSKAIQRDTLNILSVPLKKLSSKVSPAALVLSASSPEALLPGRRNFLRRCPWLPGGANLPADV